MKPALGCDQCHGPLAGQVLVVECSLEEQTKRPSLLTTEFVTAGFRQGRMVVFSLPETGGSLPRVKAVRLRYCSGCCEEEGGLNMVLMSERLIAIVSEVWACQGGRA